MKRGEKSATVVAIMEANRDKSYEVVSGMIEAKLGITNKAARAYFQHMVHTGKVTGIVVTWGRGKKLDSTPRKATAKRTKVAKVVTATQKSADEIEAIKAKNLETMREVSAKLKKKKVRDYAPGKTASPEGEGVSDFDPQLAREEIDAILRDEKLIGQVPKFAQGDY